MTIFILAKCIMHAYDLPCSCLEKRLLRIQGQRQFSKSFVIFNNTMCQKV